MNFYGSRKSMFLLFDSSKAMAQWLSLLHLMILISVQLGIFIFAIFFGRSESQLFKKIMLSSKFLIKNSSAYCPFVAVYV